MQYRQMGLVALLLLFSSGNSWAQSITESKASAPRGARVDSVDVVELERYSGRWYELARTPNLFEIGCTCVTATYQKLSDTSIGLLNACNRFNPDGPLFAIGGVGVIPNLEEPGQLKITFDGSTTAADYWIVDLVEDPANPQGPYAYASITGPQGDFIFVLSRKPVLDAQDQATYLALLKRLRSQGLPIARLNFTPQPEMCNYDAQQP